MKNFIIGISFFAGACFFSCKKVINVNLNNASPQVVITGEVTNVRPL